LNIANSDIVDITQYDLDDTKIVDMISWSDQ